VLVGLPAIALNYWLSSEKLRGDGSVYPAARARARRSVEIHRAAHADESPVRGYLESLRAPHGESPRSRRASQAVTAHADGLGFWVCIAVVCTGAIEMIVSIACALVGGRW
jgi:hypothetical protein